MKKINAVKLPEYYTSLLKSNMHATDKIHYHLGDYVRKHESFKGIMDSCFQEFSKGSNGYLGIIQNLGWHGLRDRLAAIFVNYKINGIYSSEILTSDVGDIIGFEEELLEYTVEGYSRAFLLGFYLKMDLLENSSFESKLEVDQDIIDYLKFSDVKVLKIDWLYISLSFLKDIIGKDKLEQVLSDGVDYSEIFEDLSSTNQNLLINNLLNYGFSIGEPSMFMNDLV